MLQWQSVADSDVCMAFLDRPDLSISIDWIYMDQYTLDLKYPHYKEPAGVKAGDWEVYGEDPERCK